MASDSVSQRESTLDSAGPWVVWIGIAILLAVSVGVMFDHSIGIQDSVPPSMAAVSDEAHQYAHR